MTLHKSTRAGSNKGTDKEGGQRTASCASASLPRVQESRWQQQTGAEGRSVGPRTGIMEQVTRCQDISTAQKGGHPHLGGKLQCVIEQRKKLQQLLPGKFRHCANSKCGGHTH